MVVFACFVGSLTTKLKFPIKYVITALSLYFDNFMWNQCYGKILCNGK